MIFEKHLSVSVDDLENYQNIRFFTTTLREPGIYNIQKIRIELTPEAMKEIYEKLQQGEIWVATSKSELAGKGIQTKQVKQIFKQQTVNGVATYKNITQKKVVRELTSDEIDQISKIINHSIEILQEKEASPSSKKSSATLSAPVQAPQKKRTTQEPLAEKKSIKKLQKEQHLLHVESRQLSQHQHKKDRRKKAEEAKELDAKVDERRQMQKKWDLKQEAVKTEGKARKVK